MRQITLNIQNSKFPFFMELVKSFDFVKIKQKDKELAKSMLKEEIKEAFNDIKLHKEGKKQLQSAKDFLNEL